MSQADIGRSLPQTRSTEHGAAQTTKPPPTANNQQTDANVWLLSQAICTSNTLLKLIHKSYFCNYSQSINFSEILRTMPALKLTKDITTHLFKYVKKVDIQFNRKCVQAKSYSFFIFKSEQYYNELTSFCMSISSL